MSSGIWMIKYTSVHHLVVGEIIHISLFLNGEHKQSLKCVNKGKPYNPEDKSVTIKGNLAIMLPNEN